MISILALMPSMGWADYSKYCEEGKIISQHEIPVSDVLQDYLSKSTKVIDVDSNLDGLVDFRLMCFDGKKLFTVENQDGESGLPSSIKITNDSKIPLIIHNLNIRMAESGGLSIHDNVIMSKLKVTGEPLLPVYVEGQDVVIQNSEIISADTGLELRSSKNVHIQNSRIQAITGMSVVHSASISLTQVHMDVAELGFEMDDIHLPRLKKLTLSDKELRDETYIDYITLLDQKALDVTRVGISTAENDEGDTVVTDIIGLAPSCEGKISAYRLHENEDENIYRLESAFSCTIRQVLSYDNICLKDESGKKCFQKPECIFECHGLNESDKNKLIFAHVNKHSKVMSLSDPYSLDADDIASIQMTPSELPSPLGRVDETADPHPVVGDDNILDAGIADPGMDVLAGEPDIDDDLQVLHFDGPTIGTQHVLEIPGDNRRQGSEQTVAQSGDDQSSMDAGLIGMGAGAQASCSLQANAHSIHSLWVLIMVMGLLIRRRVRG